MKNNTRTWLTIALTAAVLCVGAIFAGSDDPPLSSAPACPFAGATETESIEIGAICPHSKMKGAGSGSSCPFSEGQEKAGRVDSEEQSKSSRICPFSGERIRATEPSPLDGKNRA